MVTSYSMMLLGNFYKHCTLQGSKQRMVFKVPSRGMIGFKPLFVNMTRGEGILTRAFIG